MKKIITIAVVAALTLSLGVVAYAANNNRTSQPETSKGEQLPAEALQMDGEKPSELPEMNGQPPQMKGEKPSDLPEMIDFDGMVTKGVISQETCDKIKAYMEEHKPADLPEINGQAPEMNGQPPQMDGQIFEGNTPSDRSELPEMKGDAPIKGGLLNDLLSNGIITQVEYDALSEANAK